MDITKRRGMFNKQSIRQEFWELLVALLLVGLVFLIGGWWIHHFGSRVPGLEWPFPVTETQFSPRVFHEWRKSEGFFQHEDKFKIDV